MDAKKALATTELALANVKIVVRDNLLEFIVYNEQKIQRDAERGYKSSEMQYREAFGKDGFIRLTPIQGREMVKSLSRHFKSEGFTIGKDCHSEPIIKWDNSTDDKT